MAVRHKLIRATSLESLHAPSQNLFLQNKFAFICFFL